MIQRLQTREIQDVKTGVIFVTAEWCLPCRLAFVPTLQMAQGILIPTYQVDVVDLDLDSQDDPALPKWMEIWGIKSLPTYLIYLGGNLVSKMAGSFDSPTLIGSVEGWLDTTRPLINLRGDKCQS